MNSISEIIFCGAKGLWTVVISEKAVMVLLFLMLCDTITGWIGASILKNWTSAKAREGFMGKIIELVFVAALYALDWLFEIDFLKYFGIYYFAVCEVGSMAENISKAGGDVPQGLSEVLNAFKDSVGKRVLEKLKEIAQNL
ncbi:MAG: phage holin family protein [Clostridiales bacterium]|nr:phage holin family protein [Clostridiales bacterium]